MISRRVLLSQAAMASGVTLAAIAKPIAAQTVQSSSPQAACAVHVSTLRIIRKHFKKLINNPNHNIFASGELATAFRMHCDALQSSGINSAMTSAFRGSSANLVLTPSHLEERYSDLEKMGISLPTDAKTFITSHIVQESNKLSPKITEALHTFSILKLQRSVHGALVSGRFAGGQVQQASHRYGNTSTNSKLFRAVYEPGSARFVRSAYWDVGDDPPVGDDGWDDSDTDGVVPEELADTSLDSDGYSSSFSNWLSPTITLSSGQTIEACTVFFALISFGAGSWAAGLAFLEAVGASAGPLVLGSLTIGPAAIIGFLAILAALAGYLAVVC